MLQLKTLDTRNKEIIEDAMIIDEADNSKADLISNAIGNDMLKPRIEREGASSHKASLLKHSMSGNVCSKSFDRMNRAAEFSHFKNGNVSMVAMSAANTFTDEDNHRLFLSEGDSVVFSGKHKKIFYILIKLGFVLLIIMNVLA